MYIVMDLVVNHCSDQHEWFKRRWQIRMANMRLLLLCEGKRRQGAEQLPLVFWRKCVGAGAGNGQILPAHVRKNSQLNWENPVCPSEDLRYGELVAGRRDLPDSASMQSSTSKDTAFPSFPPDGDDGLASCVKMVEEVQESAEFLED